MLRPDTPPTNRSFHAPALSTTAPGLSHRRGAQSVPRYRSRYSPPSAQSFQTWPLPDLTADGRKRTKPALPAHLSGASNPESSPSPDRVHLPPPPPPHSYARG